MTGGSRVAAAPSGRLGPLLAAVIAGGPVVNLALQTVGYLATPTPFRPEIAWTTLHAAVPVVFAVTAVVAVKVGEPRLPVVLMIAFSYLWLPQTFFAVIAYYGSIWPLLRAVDLTWALLLGLLALAYPIGRFVGAVDRGIVALGIVVSVLRMAAVLLLDQPDVLQCNCAPNAYALTEDGAVFGTLDLVYRVVGAAIILFIAARLFWRWTRASIPARSVAFVMPIGLIAWTLALIVEAVSFAAIQPVARSFVVVSASSGPVAIVSLFAVASIPICYVAGSVHLRNTRGRVADLMRITRDGADRAVWRESLATVLRDPALEVYWWDEDSGGYRDTAGDAVEVPVEGSEPTRTLLPITTGDGTPIAVIRHDKALAANERLLDGVSTALRLSVDNGQLRTEVMRRLEQVRESRQRIVEAGDDARRRLERDLHDGSQQQLVALAMELRSLCTSARAAGNSELADQLEGTLTRLSSALRDLRELARGIHPTVLVEGGLPLALPELASRSPVPVVVEGVADLDLPDVVEATLYFAASECLTNVARHSEARQAWLRIDERGDRVRLVVRDDGIGGAVAGGGSGLLGLADRVEAVGGRVDVDSTVGEGTTVVIDLPRDVDESTPDVGTSSIPVLPRSETRV